jgi:hypothetical protein
VSTYRIFGLIADATPGGAGYDDLGPTFAIPDSTLFWPVTGGNFNRNIERIDRNTEARGRRAASPPLSFRGRPEMTIPVPAYRTVLEKAMYAAMGPSITGGSPTYPTPTGSAGVGYTHTWTAQKNPSFLPAYHAQLVRDNLNSKMSGSYFNQVTMTFPLDGEATLECDLMGLYWKHFDSDLNQVGPAVNAQQTITVTGTPTGGSFTLTYGGQTATIAFGSTAAQVVTALTALSTIGAGGVTATGGPLPATPVVVTFVAQLAGTAIPLPIVNNTGFTGGASPAAAVTQTVVGVPIDTNYLVPPTTTFTGLSPNVLILRDAKMVVNGTLVPIPDFQGFSLVWNNNLNPKWFAGQNVQATTFVQPGLWAETPPSQVKKLWYPNENRLTGMQDVTGTLDFGNANTAQEIAADFAQIERLIFTVTGDPITGTSPLVNEAVVITMADVVVTGGGAGDLTARDDIVSSFQFQCGWDETLGYDLQFQVLNGISTRIS